MGYNPGMSRANVEIVRRFFDLVGAADIETVTASETALRELAADVAAEDFEWITAEGGKPLRDFDAVLESHREWLEPWEEAHQELEEVLEVGDNVIAVVRLRARAKLSGIEAAMHTHFVFTFRDGKVTRVVEHLERDDALQAAGPPED